MGAKESGRVRQADVYDVANTHQIVKLDEGMIGPPQSATQGFTQPIFDAGASPWSFALSDNLLASFAPRSTFNKSARSSVLADAFCSRSAIRDASEDMGTS